MLRFLFIYQFQFVFLLVIKLRFFIKVSSDTINDWNITDEKCNIDVQVPSSLMLHEKIKRCSDDYILLRRNDVTA